MSTARAAVLSAIADSRAPGSVRLVVSRSPRPARSATIRRPGSAELIAQWPARFRNCVALRPALSNMLTRRVSGHFTAAGCGAAHRPSEAEQLADSADFL